MALWSYAVGICLKKLLITGLNVLDGWVSAHEKRGGPCEHVT